MLTRGSLEDLEKLGIRPEEGWLLTFYGFDADDDDRREAGDPPYALRVRRRSPAAANNSTPPSNITLAGSGTTASSLASPLKVPVTQNWIGMPQPTLSRLTMRPKE